jgi:hypothetical protein
MDKINQWLNHQPYNISMTVYINPKIENMKQFYYEQSDARTRRSINRSVEVENTLARMDFLEDDLAELDSYDLALEIITRAKENK